jgi:hypothetical protein
MSHTDFYEKAHFVKPTWRQVSVAVAQLLISDLRAMLLSALSLGEPTLRWLGA